MADADVKDEVQVEVDDDSVVTVELDGDLPPLNEAKDAVADAKTKNGKDAGVVTSPPVKDSADEAAQALQKQLDAANRRAAAAEATAASERNRAEAASRAAVQHKEEADAAQDQIKTSQVSGIKTTIETANKSLVSAKAAYQKAMEAGDFAGAADAQETMADAKADIKIATQRLADIEATPAAVRTTDTGRVVDPAAGLSAFERYVTRSNFSPTAQAWLRAHPDCVPAEVGGSAQKNAKMMQGHWAAKGKGLEEGSQAYFDAIEEYIADPAADTTQQQQQRPAPQQQQRRATPSAAPSRDVPSADGRQTNPRSVRLNAAQQEVALYSYAQKEGEDEAAWKKRAYGLYASELIKATNEGKIGRLTH